MRTAAIICEFNPFHSGHSNLFRLAREKGAENILCIMSGNFVQRGEPAIADKYTRAEIAIKAGADIVVELPMPFSSAGAEYFAKAGVYIADRLGFADELIFGSELGDIEKLIKIADRQSGKEFLSRVNTLHKGELGYALSCLTAYEELYGKNDSLSKPNNILAIEYLKAIKRLNSGLEYSTVKRVDNYSKESDTGEYPSATELRHLIMSGKEEAAFNMIPSFAKDVLCSAKDKGLFPVDMKKYGFAILSHMRMSEPDMLSDIENLSGGLQHRAVRCAGEASSYDELLSLLATKKYTHARLRRALLFTAIGVHHDDVLLNPYYVNLLAVSVNGKKLLSRERKNNGLPIVTKMSEKRSVISSLDDKSAEKALRMLRIESKADALYSLCLPCIRESGFFGKMPPYAEK
ncbi:MAG: nucleotidyltransferase family protein [Clostridia bacterium]|nr:nucleotidyltransferase family protein [Clostridia bacterium]